MRKHTELLLGLVVILALVAGLVASCAPAVTPTVAPPAATPTAPTPTPSPPSPTPTTPPPAGPKRGGILKWAREGISMNLDPVWTDSNLDVWIYPNYYEPLVRVNSEGTAIEPALAESWDISDDGLVYTFHLRPGVKFHDGSLLQASDVVWSLDRARDPDAGIWSWSLENVDKIEVVDDSTVDITLKAPSSNFLSMMGLFNASILPQKIVGEMGEEEFFKHPIGTGPFKVTEYVVSDYMVLEKNPYYWDLAPDGEPFPYLDGIKIVQVPEGSTRPLQVQSGDMDATDTIPFSLISELEVDPNVSVQLWPSTITYYIFLNHRKPPMDDVKVRMAMNYALDKQALIDTVVFGKGEEATSFRPKAGVCWNSDLEGFPYGLEKARQLMAESNYPDGYEDLEVAIMAGNVMMRDIATIVKEMWAEIGIEANVQEFEGAMIRQRYYQDDHVVLCGWSWTDDVLDAQQQEEYFAVSPALHSGWQNNRAVELAEAAVLELDQDKRCEMYEEIQKIFNDEAVAVLLFHTPFNVLVRNDVKGFSQIPLGWLIWRETWLDR